MSQSADFDYREPEWVAERLGLDRATVYRMLQDGTIPAIQLGRKWLVSESRLSQWLADETARQTVERRDAVKSAHRTIRQFENYAADARKALKIAHTEARQYGHPLLGPEHLLLGLAAQPGSMAGRILLQLGIERARLRQEVERERPARQEPVPRRLGRTAEAKRAMRLAGRLAARDGQSTGGDHGLRAEPRIDTEHLLMGLLLSRDGLAHRLLKSMGVQHRRLKAAMMQLKDTRKSDQKEPT